MNWLFDEARRRGLTKITGTVRGNNKRALAFYDRIGFRVVSELPDRTFERNGQTYCMILIEKELN